jgi:hypothetical protein
LLIYFEESPKFLKSTAGRNSKLNRKILSKVVINDFRLDLGGQDWVGTALV